MTTTVPVTDIDRPEPLVDAHAHFFPTDLPGGPGWPDGPWPRLDTVSTDGPGTGRIMVGDSVFRKVRSSLWDVAARTTELDEAAVEMQLVSPTPILLTYWSDPRTGQLFARAVNDGLAEHVRAGGPRLRGLGTVPLQDPVAAAAELRRAIQDLGLDGVEIGTHAAGRELDDPALTPFYEAAEELDAILYVHPLDGGGDAIRRRGQPYDFGLGMLTDTAMAATALIHGGVLERHPGLRVVLAHGCGTLAWAAPRLAYIADALGSQPDSPPFDELMRRLWVDSLVFDPEHFRLLARRFGPDHIVFGTDFPFIPGQLTGGRQLIADAVACGALTQTDGRRILGDNARALLQRTSPTHGGVPANGTTASGADDHR